VDVDRRAVLWFSGTEYTGIRVSPTHCDEAISFIDAEHMLRLGCVLTMASSKRPHAVAFPASRQGWNDALWQYCASPEQHPDDVHFYDDAIVVMRDKFAKSRHHLLTMPRQKIDGLKDLTREHLPLLDAMYERSLSVRDELLASQGAVCVPFRIGFHAVPSMKQLHMHIVSQDFDVSLPDTLQRPQQRTLHMLTEY
jgi:diadenosine tetraphosphate (Ap4A) HIT family hydrolase